MSDEWYNNKQEELLSEIRELQSKVVKDIDVVEHAKIVRQALKEQFPYLKFKVKTRRFSGGDSVTVYVIGDIPRITDTCIGAFVHTLDGYRGDLCDSIYNVGFEYKGERFRGATFCMFNHSI